jgi:hypothetical protein
MLIRSRFRRLYGAAIAPRTVPEATTAATATITATTRPRSTPALNDAASTSSPSFGESKQVVTKAFHDEG